MPNDVWPKVPIENVSLGIFDGPHATPKKTTHGPVFLGIETLSGGRIDLTKVDHLSEEDFCRWTRRVVPQPDDLVFSYETRLGEVALVPEGLRCCLGRRMALVRPDRAKIVPRFLLYYFLGPEFQEVIRKHTVHGSTVDRIPLRDFPSFPVRVPPLAQQEEIAGVLGALDDKIDLNRRMNETLEAIARAIFKSRLVDFEPVREGHPDFPLEFENSPLGFVPKGWSVSALENICQVAIGGDWGEDDPTTGSVEVACLRGVDLENLRRNGEAMPPRRWIKGSSLEKRRMTSSDVLVAGSGAGPVGRSLWVCPWLERSFNVPVIYSNFCKRITAESVVMANYIDRILYSMRESGEIFEYVTGTSVPNLDLHGLLRRRKVPVPPVRVLEDFAQIVAPITERLYSGENRTLAALRDALLSKLLSGEIRVKQAEKMVGEAV